MLTFHALAWVLVVLLLSLLLFQKRQHPKTVDQVEEESAEARSIQDTSAEGIVTTTNSGKITKFNLAAERIFGYKAENLIGKNFLLLLPKDARKTHKNIMSGSRSNAASSSHELSAQKADGTLFPLAITIKPIREHGRRIFLGMFRDNSALKQAEANSRENRCLMEFLLQSSPIVFYTCSAKDGFPVTYVSPNAEELLGYKPETITGATAFWPRYIHPDDFDHLHPNRMSRFKESRQEIEYRLKLPNGSYRWFSDSRIMVTDENGEPDVLIGSWTDIHEKREMENDLTLREERVRIGLSSARLTCWDWVINTGEITWTGQLDEKLGLGKTPPVDFEEFSATAHPEDRENLLTAFRQCLVEDAALDIEYRVVWQDKSIHWVHLTGELINDEIGSPVRMVGALSDISGQKQLYIAPLLEAKLAS
jgi:PAS domain S-box-containing protein